MGTVEETKKPTKPKKPKSKMKVDTLNIVFFAVMILGLILFTVILLLKANTKSYVAEFGDDISSTVTLSGSDQIEIAVEVKDITQIQKGTYTEITDDDIEYNYLVTIENTDSTEQLEFIVNDDNTLTLKYEDGTEVIYKEK